ncbi:MAG TPA: hypothetical protein VFE72_02885 [Lysobacter sp.]|nr:hypothetical protein [Lysobacter sp.]
MSPRPLHGEGLARTAFDPALLQLRARAASIFHPDPVDDLTEAELRAVIEAHEKRAREAELAVIHRIRTLGA